MHNTRRFVGDWKGNPDNVVPLREYDHETEHVRSPAATLGGGMGLLIGTYAAATLAKRRRAARAHAAAAKKH
jgi:hypothetical protein